MSMDNITPGQGTKQDEPDATNTNEENEEKTPQEFMDVNGNIVNVTGMSPEERRNTIEEANN